MEKRVRQELFPMISFLTTSVQCATLEDWQKLDRGLRYVNGTQDLGIVIGTGDELSVTDYVDAA